MPPPPPNPCNHCSELDWLGLTWNFIDSQLKFTTTITSIATMFEPAADEQQQSTTLHSVHELTTTHFWRPLLAETVRA